MARRRRTPQQGANLGKRKDDDVVEYGMKQSREQLAQRGFTPRVTDMTVDETIRAWFRMADRKASKPTFDEYQRMMEIRARFIDHPVAHMIRAFPLLLPSSEHIKNRVPEQASYLHMTLTHRSGTNPSTLTLSEFLQATDIGCVIAEELFADGYATVKNLALTSRDTWASLANHATVWDFNAGSMQHEGGTKVLVVMAPDILVGQLQLSSGEYYKRTGREIAVPIGHLKAIKREEDMLHTLSLLWYRATGQKNPSSRLPASKQKKFLLQKLMRSLGHSVLESIREIEDQPKQWNLGQCATKKSWQLFEPTLGFAAQRLQHMATTIFKRGTYVTVLHFHKVPLMDRRLLAVMLRACPRVTMLGIYNCPLIHFGDVTTLLDLLYEINEERKQARVPPIEALDFFPRYIKSLPYKEEEKSEWVADQQPWLADFSDGWHRGFFTILMIAFMKAKKSGIGLLFAPGKAFRSFLFQVPNPPLFVPCFLDAMERYLNLRSRPKLDDEKKKILFDILKPVRLSCDRGYERECPEWYDTSTPLLLCASCGYRMHEQFFSSHNRSTLSRSICCSGCILRLWLDNERVLEQGEKRRMLDVLFPMWTQTEFNVDAPLATGSFDLIHLYTTATEHEAPIIFLDNEGHIMQAQVARPPLRDQNIHNSSLRNLGTLQDLVVGPEAKAKWKLLKYACLEKDLGQRAKFATRTVSNALTIPRFSDGLPNHSYSMAIEGHHQCVARGW